MDFLSKSGLAHLWNHTITRLNSKVDKIEGKSLSTEDFTTEEKIKLASIPSETAANQVFTTDKEGNPTWEDKPFWSEEVYTLEVEQTLSSGALLGNPPPASASCLSAGLYKIILDDTDEYFHEKTQVGIIAVGDSSYSQYPFYIKPMSGRPVIYFQDGQSHKVKIELMTQQFHPIEEKFIPEEIARVDHTHSWEVLEDKPFHKTLNNKIQAYSSSNFSGVTTIPISSSVLTIGDYQIVFNNVEYNCIIEVGTTEIGPQENFPFTLKKRQTGSSEYTWFFTCSDKNSTNNSLLIYKMFYTLVKLDEIFIPSTIARTENLIGQKDSTKNGEIFNDYKNNVASGEYAHAEGYSTEATGTDSHAEGYSTKATAGEAHAEGLSTEASGSASHSEGYKTKATADVAHAEGYSTEATAGAAHAEGNQTIASGTNSHAEGYTTKAIGENSHAEGLITEASGSCSHAEGTGTIAAGADQHAEGIFNISDVSTYIHITGNGASASNRSNAYTLDRHGNGWFSGDIYVGSTSGTNRDEGSKKLATEEYVIETISSSTFSWNDLADKPFGEKTATTYFLENFIIPVRDNNGSITIPSDSIVNSAVLDSNETITVIYDGQTYNCKVSSSDAEGMGYLDYFAGNRYLAGSYYPDSGEPFLIKKSGATGSVYVYTNDSNEHVISAYTLTTTISPIPEEYIPTTVPVIQSATVGQTAIVKSVDENGKPMEWEATNRFDKPFINAIKNGVTPDYYLEGTYLENWKFYQGSYLPEYSNEINVNPNATDNTEVINSLIDKTFNNGGGCIYFEKGTYLVNGEIHLKPNVVLLGEVAGGTVFIRNYQKNNSEENHMIIVENAYSCGIKNITLNGNFSENCGGILITKTDTQHGNVSTSFQNSTFSDISNVILTCFSLNGIKSAGNVWVYNIHDLKISYCNGYGVYIDSTDNSYSNIDISYCEKGAYFIAQGQNRINGGKLFYNGGYNASTDWELYYAHATIVIQSPRNLLTNLDIQDNRSHGIFINNTNNNRIDNCNIDACGVEYNRDAYSVVFNGANENYIGCNITNYLIESYGKQHGCFRFFGTANEQNILNSNICKSHFDSFISNSGTVLTYINNTNCIVEGQTTGGVSLTRRNNILELYKFYNEESMTKDTEIQLGDIPLLFGTIKDQRKVIYLAENVYGLLKIINNIITFLPYQDISSTTACVLNETFNVL